MAGPRASAGGRSAAAAAAIRHARQNTRSSESPRGSLKPKVVHTVSSGSLDSGFAGAVQAARAQLQQLAELVSRLEEEHELALARFAPGSPVRSASRPAAELVGAEPPPAGAAGSDSVEEHGGYMADQASALREALQDQGVGDVAKVHKLLQQGADPNMQLGSFQCKGPALQNSTPLAVAVLHQNLDMVRTLVEAKAAPDSEYSFEAGAERRVWSFPASHACIPVGNTHMLRELFLFGADVQACGSNGANMVWQAAYFGQSEVLEFVLQQRADPEKRAQSQDNNALSYTPLHIAAKEGHAGVVRVLLNAKASFEVDDDGTREPLDEAVEHGHTEVVRLLVSKQADIFQGRRTEKRLSLETMGKSLATKIDSGCFSDSVSGPAGYMKKFLRAHTRTLVRSCSVGGALLTTKHVRRIDTVFSSGSPMLVLAVAKGLGDAPELPVKFTRHDLIQFLVTPGEAATQIWKSIFKKQALRYWEQRGDLPQSVMRVTKRAAFLPSDERMEFALGPTAKALLKRYNQKQTLPTDFQKFMRCLGPMAPMSTSDIFMPVHFYTCRVPHLQGDLQLMMAIADCENEEIFDTAGCRALVNLKWRTLKIHARYKLLLTAAEVANLVWLNVIQAEEGFEDALDVANGLALAVVFLATLEEICSAVGYISQGLGGWYLQSGGHIFDTSVLALTFAVVSWNLAYRKSIDEPVYRIIFGLCVYLKWLRLLTSLRQIKVVGLRILPILHTMWDVKPFLAVLIMNIVASLNMYYALNIHTMEDTFLIIYRLTVLGDVNLYELENESNLRLKAEEGGGLVQVPPPRTHYALVVRVMMVFMSFVVGVSLMNLFVAMLCESYVNAVGRAHWAFMRAKAHLVLDQQAVRMGVQVFCCRKQRRQRRRLRASHGDDAHREPDRDEEEEDKLSHIWYCLPEM